MTDAGCTRVFHASTVEDMQDLARRLAPLLPPGTVMGLRGDLGAGKTTFVQGLADGLGLDPAIRVNSPSFTLINLYPTRIPLAHMDVYRIEDPEELEGIGFDDFLRPPYLAAIEWFDKLESWGVPVPPDRLLLVDILADDPGDDTRTLRLTAAPGMVRDILAL